MMEDLLTKSAEELGRIVSDVEEKVNRAREAKEEINEQVNKWLEEAYNMRTKLTSRIKSSRDDVTILSDLVARGKSVLCVSFSADPEGIELVWREGFVDFESRKYAFDKVMSCLKGEDVSTIGIFGMGGIGKTKLVVEIGKKAKDDKLFDQVIIATVSQNPNIRNIQGTLADMLNLRIEKMTERGRANELCARMEGKDKILVILDDIWEKIDLETIGIPSYFRNKASKIILTTRREEVCKNMGCSLTLCLDVIDEDEAWDLFCKYARLHQRPNSFKSKGKQIVRECAGLPLAILIVGSSLRDKSLEDYEDAARRLSKSIFVCAESVDGVDLYACLKLSYDYLKDIIAQKCFLLCSLFPEDMDIAVELLIRYAYGLGWLENADSVDLARRMIFCSVEKLEDACLLFNPEKISDSALYPDSFLNRPFVKMHDVVRDFALCIASKEYGHLLNSLPQITMKKFQEKAFGVYLTASDLDSLHPNQLHCSKLQILLMHDYMYKWSDGLVPKKNRTPGGFFNKTTTLQVLHMLTREESLPVSLTCLVNLRTLHFGGGYVRDDELFMIEKLKNLEILQLTGRLYCGTILPEWIGKLYNLRLLDLSGWTSLTEIPCNLLSKLAKLEEFYGPYRLMDQSDYMSDLMLLPRLNVFTGWFREQVSLPGDFNIKRLHKYCISYADDLHLHNGWSKMLGIYCEDELSAKCYQQFWAGVECLWIKGAMQGVFNICPQLDTTGFKNLRELWISNSENLKYLIDTTESWPGLPNLTVSVLPNLVKLELKSIKHLIKTCNGLPPLDYLGKLRYAMVKDCPRLNNLFPLFGTQMEELEIDNCDALKYVYEVEAELSPKIIRLSNLKKLQRIWKGPYQLEREELIDEVVDTLYPIDKAIFRSSGTPVNITIEQCDELEEVFPHLEYCNWKCVGQFSNLAELHLKGLPKLKCIWQGTPQNYSLHKLVRIYLVRCDNLTSLFTTTLAKSLLNLQELWISLCGSLETIVMQDDSCETGKGPNGTYTQSSFQELRIIEIKSCNNLKSVLPISVIAQGLLKLERISIKDCPNLGRVFGDGERSVTKTTEFVFKNLQKLFLADLPRLVCLFPRPSVDGIAMTKQEEHWILSHEFILGLKVLRIRRCFNNTPEVLFDIKEVHHPILSQLKWIEVKDMPDLKCLWKGPTEFISCCKLDQLKVVNCVSMKSLLPLSMARNLLNLRELTVKNCPELQHIFYNDIRLESRKSTNSKEVQLHILQLQPQDELNWASGSLPNLTEICVRGCDKLKTLFPLSIAQHLPRLEYLIVEKAMQLEQLFIEDRYGCDVVNDKNDILLPVLREIKLQQLPRLCSICPQDYVLSFQSFISQKKVVIEKCKTDVEFSYKLICKNDIILPNIKTLSQLVNLSCVRHIIVNDSMSLPKYLFPRSIAHALSSLEILEVFNCKELETIIEPRDDRVASLVIQPSISSASCFPQLTHLRIEGCDRLQNIFPLSLARNFPRLKYVKIERVCLLENIFFEDREEGYAGCNLIELPELESVDLIKLPRYCGLCPAGYILNCPQSTSRSVKLNSGLSVDSPYMCVDDNNIDVLFEFEETIVTQYEQSSHFIFRSMSLKDLPNLACIWKGPPKSINLSRLNYLCLSQCGSQQMKSLFTRTVAQTLQSLETLYIINCKELEHLIEPVIAQGPALLIETNNSLSTCFPRLKHLFIEGCDKLKTVFPLSIAQHFPELCYIDLIGASELEEIFTDDRNEECEQLKECTSTLPQLTILKIKGCDRLKNVFPLSLARCLPRLTKVFVEQVPQLKNIFFEDREIGYPGCKLIELPELETLVLHQLPLLCGLCPVGYVLKCPKYTSLMDKIGPEFSVMLPFVNVENSNIEVLVELEETAISQNPQFFLFGSGFVWLYDLPNLACIWKGPSEFINLSHLEHLLLVQCGSQQMKSLFTRTIAQTLHSLERLYIWDCKELENLIEPTREGGSATCFPSLMLLYLRGCDKLKTVFPLSITQCLPQLRYLYVIGARELEEIFTEDRNEEDTGFIKLIKLPELTELYLEKLPRMSQLCPPGYALCCPTPLYDFKISIGCPLLDSTTCFPPLYKA